MDRLFPKLKDASEEQETRRTLNRMYDMIASLEGRLSSIESKPVQLSSEQQKSIARDAVSLIGVLAQPLIGGTADPLLSSVPQSPGTGTVTSVQITVSGNVTGGGTITTAGSIAIGFTATPSFTTVTINGAKQSSGNGTPEGAVLGSVGDTFHRLDGGAGTSLYVKESGANTNTGWAGK